MSASIKSAAALATVLLCVSACAQGANSAPGGSGPSSSPTSPSMPPTPIPSPVPSPTPLAVLPGEPWIAYTWDLHDGNGWGMYLVRPDGSDNHHILTELPGEQRAPAWSPDGTRLAFVELDPSNANSPDGAIWISEADGSDATRFFDGGDQCTSVFHPSWSPDGKKLALICYSGADASSVAVLDLASMAFTPLVKVSWPDFFDNPPRWSPDGEKLAFAIQHWDPSNTFLDGSLVATVSVDGGKEHRLTTSDTFMSAPDWSPDGTELVVNSYDLGNASDLNEPSNLYAIKPDGTGLHQLTRSSIDGSMKIGQPRWDPEGKRILVAVMKFSPDHTEFDSVHLAFVDAKGGEPVVISPYFNGKYADIRQTP